MKQKINIRSFEQLSEKDAYALLQMASGNGKSPFEPIRQKILDLISKGQNYGIVMAETADKQKMAPEECKKAVISINMMFKKSGTKFAIRYVPNRDGFLFVPEAKIIEMFGKV